MLDDLLANYDAWMERARLFFLKRSFNGKNRAKTWNKLAAMLQEGLSQYYIMSKLRDRQIARKSRLAIIFDDMVTRIDNGETLDVVVADWVPEEETMLIRAGVVSGHLPEVLLDCVELIEAKEKIMSGLVGAIAYPCFLFCLVLGYILVIALYAVPEFSTVSDPATWTGMAWALYVLSSFVASPFGVVALVLLIFTAIASVVSLPYWTGPARLHVEKVPPWSVYRLVTGSVWLFSVATLMKGGLNLEVVLGDMLAGKTLLPWLRERVEAIATAYHSGDNLGQILLHLGMHFPDDELVEDLADYATLSTFNDKLYGISKRWLNDGVKTIGAILNGMNIAMMVCNAVATGWMFLAFNSLQKQMMNGAGF